MRYLKFICKSVQFFVSFGQICWSLCYKMYFLKVSTSQRYLEISSEIFGRIVKSNSETHKMVSKATNKNLSWKFCWFAMNSPTCANSDTLQSSGFCNMVGNSSENTVIFSNKMDTCQDE